MSLYPPLRPDQLSRLRDAVDVLRDLRSALTTFPLTHTQVPGDENKLLEEVAELRGSVQTLDRELFAIYGLVHCLKDSGLPVTAPPPVKPASLPSSALLGLV